MTTSLPAKHDGANSEHRDHRHPNQGRDKPSPHRDDQAPRARRGHRAAAMAGALPDRQSASESGATDRGADPHVAHGRPVVPQAPASSIPDRRGGMEDNVVNHLGEIAGMAISISDHA